MLLKRVFVFSVLLLLTRTPAHGADLDRDTRINIDPLFYSRAENKNEDLEALGPFFSYTLDGQKESWAVRPLISYQRDRDKNVEEWQFLYPLGKYRLTPKERYVHFLPLLSGKKNLGTEAEEKSARNFDLFPFFWGRTENGEPYGGVFPIYGEFKERFSRDEITFFLWPLYSRSKWEGNEKTTIAWPVLSWTTGETDQAFRLWPLFGHEEKAGEYDRNFLLWPIFYYAHDDLDTEPLTKKMAFPLYISETSATVNRKIVLWPLFNYHRNIAQDFTQWDLPWPFIRYVQSPDFTIRQFWPLYRLKEKQDLYDLTLFWPVYRYTKQDLVEEGAVKTTYRFLLLSKSEKKVWTKENKEERTARLWPFFFAKSSRDGSSFLHIPAIVPIYDEGYERNYGPIFRVYEHRHSSDGEEKLKLLWGLYRSNCKAGHCLRELSFLASWESSPEKSRVTLLHGLFEYLRTTDHKALKLFYIPEILTWSSGGQVTGGLE